ncbi:integrase core domain-containing protein [Actinobaculum sp. 313]|uniref:integrase core domain-containing protein n=1 Tax=Actinobaculum sp. 313 TaxID=2495645 RepID=UPI0013DE1A34|nr:integrase core domain-containing protein [Actinobaculum sp. 313]
MQYRAIRYGQALSEADAVASVGSKGDSYDNALAEALNSLYKAELIRNHHYLDSHGPWEGIDDVEFATAQWVHWFNTTRPHCAIGMHAPIQHEQAYTPPPQDDTNCTTTDTTDTIDLEDIGKQTTNHHQPPRTSNHQPATTNAR